MSAIGTKGTSLVLHMSAFGVTADIDRSYGFPYDATFLRLPIGKNVAVGALRNLNFNWSSWSGKLASK